MIDFLEENTLEQHLQAYRLSMRLESEYSNQQFEDKNLIYPNGSKYFQNSFSIHPNATLNLFDEYLMQCMEASYLRPIEIQNKIDQYLKKIKTYERNWKNNIAPNHAGKQLLFISKASLMEQIIKIYKINTIKDLINLKAAALLYKNKHNKLPSTLKDLQPYLKRPYYDAFAKKEKIPYFYDASRGAIWSVGENFTNERGVKIIDYYYLFSKIKAEDLLTFIHPPFNRSIKLTKPTM